MQISRMNTDCQSRSSPQWENSSWPDLRAWLHHVSANQLCHRACAQSHPRIAFFSVRPLQPVPEVLACLLVPSIPLCVKIRRRGRAARRLARREHEATGRFAAAALRASMGGSAIDGLIFADFRATNPLVVQISVPFRRSRLSRDVHAAAAAAKSVAGRLNMHSGADRPAAPSLKTNQ